MNRIPTIFQSLRQTKRKALMPFITGGHPTPAATAQTLPALARAGASIVEVGIPFSDPIADGPTIAAAMHDVLTKGVTVQQVFDAVREARRDPACKSLGIVAMVSVSIVHKLGIQQFINDSKSAGFDGFIIPDAPLEESASLAAPINDAGMTLSLLVAPTTPPERAARIAQACTGFVYLLARTGITGTQSGAPDFSKVAQRVKELRNATDLPIACGFGISTPDHVRACVNDSTGAGADAAIVGSALVKKMSDAGDKAPQVAEQMCRELSAGL